jgi:hypothetical protein
MEVFCVLLEEPYEKDGWMGPIFGDEDLKVYLRKTLEGRF